MNRTPISKTLALAAALAALIAGAFAAPARADYSDDYGDAQPAGYDTGYSYIRVLEGSATLIQGSALDGDGGERAQAEVNQPVLAGDRLWVGPRSRAEVLLSDRNLLRLDGETEVAFEQLAFSPESSDRVTTLRLLRGNAQLVVTSESLGEQLPRIDTLNAAIYPQDFGVYRITTDGGDWTEVVVRRGRAEVVSGGETVAVAAGDKALVEGGDGRWADVRAAGGYDGLERWADELGRRAEAYDVPYLDEDLRYAAAPLEDHGRWVEVSGSYAWRPRVDTGWRPYWHGRWAYTPAGVTWISSEPWGWVPYHYGTWDYVSGYGWVWFPGRRFAPAWVYWHWGSSHVAWVPVGYYTRHYRHGYPGFRFGVYGWAGGDPGFFADWVFCDRSYFGRRHHERRFYRGHDWRRHHGGHAVPRGILTTDTRPLRPSLWDDPEGSVRALRTRPGIADRRGLEELPDVSAFVSKRGGELPRDVATRVAITRGEVDRVAGTPLAPGTRAPEVRLARPRAGIRGGGGSEAASDSPRTVVTPGVRSSRPGSDLRGEASGAPDRDRGSLSESPRARSGRPVVIERDDAPRAESPRADSPRRDDPAAGRPGTVIRRAPPAAGSEGTGGSNGSTGSGDRDSLSGRRAVRPRDGGGAEGPPPSSGRSLSGSSPRAERPSRPESSAGAEDRGRSGIAVRPRAERPAPPPSSSRSDDRSSLGGRAPAPRAERPTTVRPRAVEPWGSDRRGSSPSASSPGTTVRRSAPPPSSSPRAERPSVSRPPVADRALSSGLRAPAPRREPTARSAPAPSRPPVVRSAPSRPPTVRSAPAPSRPPTVRSAPAPSRPPVVRSAPAPSRPPVVRSSPSRPAPSARTQPSRPSQPRSTPSAGSSSRGGDSRSAPRAESGSSRSGGGGGDRGTARTRGGGRDRG